MPRYELLLITRALAKQSLRDVLRRTANNIFEQDGIIRSIQNMGSQELPYRMKSQAEWHTHGHYFLFDVHIKTPSISFIKKEFKFDYDIIRPSLIKKSGDFDEKEKKTPHVYECDVSYQKPYQSRR